MGNDLTLFRSRWFRLLAILGVLSLLAACSGSSSSDDDEAVDSGDAVANPAPPLDSDPVTPPGTGPDVSFSASSAVIASGSSVVLNWNSTQATSCTASGGWTGDLSVSGSQTVGPLTQNTTFTLGCTDGSATAIQMLTVSVSGLLALNWQAPTENVDGTPLTDLASYRIYYGEGSRNYSETVNVADPAAVTHSFTLISGSYYVAMTAIDIDGNESAFSNEVLKSTQ